MCPFSNFSLFSNGLNLEVVGRGEEKDVEGRVEKNDVLSQEDHEF